MEGEIARGLELAGGGKKELEIPQELVTAAAKGREAIRSWSFPLLPSPAQLAWPLDRRGEMRKEGRL